MINSDIEFTIHNSWRSNGNTLYLESMKGHYDCSKWGRGDHFEDRRFLIRINDSQRFAFSHDTQIALLEAVLTNDALPHRFIQNCEKFLHTIYRIKGERKKFEREKFKIDLKNYMQPNLWNCGRINEDS